MYMAGIKLNHVPYKGSGPAQQDLMSGIIRSASSARRSRFRT